MQIAILGAGSVGTALAAACRRVGHEVRVGLRDPDDPKHGDVPGRTTLAAAIDGADVAILAVPAGALPDLLEAVTFRPPTVVLDATNAVGAPPPGGASTVGSFVRGAVAPEVPVAKAFNTIGAEHMVDGMVDGRAAFLPVAGDPEAASAAVDLARAIGFDAFDIGGLDAIEMVEDHARLWIHLMRRGWGRGFGFGVLGRPQTGS